MRCRGSGQAHASVTISAITWLAPAPPHTGDSGLQCTRGSPNFLTWHGVHLHVNNHGLFQHLLQNPGGRVGRQVQGVSQSRAYLMEVSSDRAGRAARAGFPYQGDELFPHSTPCNLHEPFVCSSNQKDKLAFSAAPCLPLQVGHPVLPPSGLHPCVHHGAGPGSQAGA